MAEIYAIENGVFVNQLCDVAQYLRMVEYGVAKGLAVSVTEYTDNGCRFFDIAVIYGNEKAIERGGEHYTAHENLRGHLQSE